MEPQKSSTPDLAPPKLDLSKLDLSGLKFSLGKPTLDPSQIPAGAKMIPVDPMSEHVKAGDYAHANSNENPRERMKRALREKAEARQRKH